MNRFLLVATIFAIAGCATPGQETGQSEHLQAFEPAGEELPQSNPSAEVQTMAAAGDELQAPESSMESYDVIEDIDAPVVTETPIAMMPPPPPAEPEVICTREVVTGSILKTKVCRRRVDIERQREMDQQALRRIKTEIAAGTARPGIGPGQ